MDNFSDFFKELRNRLSNPLIFSFIAAWLIVNWRITLGIILYTKKELASDGYSSYFDLIQKESDNYKLLTLPLLIAIGYTILFPLLKTAVKAFNAWIERWSDEWYYKIIQKGPASMEKYLQLQRDLHEQQNELSELIRNESKFKNEKLKAEEALKNIEAASRELQSSHDKLVESQSPKILQGTWQVAMDGQEEEFEITGNIILEEGVTKYFITSFFCNIQERKIAMVLNANNGGQPNPKVYKIILLGFGSKLMNLQGVDHVGNEVHFSKIEDNAPF